MVLTEWDNKRTAFESLANILEPASNQTRVLSLDEAGFACIYEVAFVC